MGSLWDETRVKVNFVQDFAPRNKLHYVTELHKQPLFMYFMQKDKHWNKLIDGSCLNRYTVFQCLGWGISVLICKKYSADLPTLEMPRDFLHLHL